MIKYSLKHKNNDHIIYNIAQLYFILGRAELHWIFSSIPKDDSDINFFFQQKVALRLQSH